MTTIEPDCLADWLKEHKNEIDWVSLEWTYPVTYEIESNYRGTYYGGENVPLYHRFSAIRMDFEYSYEGYVDGAIEFSENYGCWDGQTIEIENGIVIGRVHNDNPGNDEYPDNDNDLAFDTEVYDITYEGLYCYGRDHRAQYFPHDHKGYIITRIDKDGDQEE